MKQRIRFFTILTLIFGMGLTLVACDDDDDEPPKEDVILNFEAELNGANEVPANEVDSTGTATATYNKTTKILTVDVTHDVEGATAAHIHKGAIGENGDVVFPFPSADSPMKLTTDALTTEQEKDLEDGMYYINIHTEAYPGGIIRGQLEKKAATE